MQQRILQPEIIPREYVIAMYLGKGVAVSLTVSEVSALRQMTAAC